MNAREWARDNGYDVGDRGKLPAHITDAYRAAVSDSAAPADPPPMDGWADPETPASEPAEPPTGEQVPRNVRALPARSRVRTRLNWGKPKDAKGRPRQKKRPRVPVDRLISNTWGMLATAARPLPPTSRVLRLQAPVAGVILEDAVRDTVVDGLLQPLARFEAGGEAVFALAGPPLLTTAIAANPQAAPFLIPVLRESLMVLVKIAGPRVAEAMAKGAADEQSYGPQVDAMLALLFADLPTTAEEAQQQEDMMRAAQQVVQGQPA